MPRQMDISGYLVLGICRSEVAKGNLHQNQYWIGDE